MHRVAGLARSIALATTVALVLAACGYGDDGRSPSHQPGESVAIDSPEPTIEPTEPPGTALPAGQAESVWGPIWDALPATYPVPDGSRPADPEDGPVSAAFTVPVATTAPRQLAEFYRDALDERGYGTGLDGPLEDGSFTVWSSSGYGCDSLVTILPRGEESLITVLYGTGCRFE